MVAVYNFWIDKYQHCPTHYVSNTLVILLSILLPILLPILADTSAEVSLRASDAKRKGIFAQIFVLVFVVLGASARACEQLCLVLQQLQNYCYYYYYSNTNKNKKILKKLNHFCYKPHAGVSSKKCNEKICR